jgi:hypothetical protein
LVDSAFVKNSVGIGESLRARNMSSDLCLKTQRVIWSRGQATTSMEADC